MDVRLRDLERAASGGDERALLALEQEWHRRGLGWHGESLPSGLRRADERGLYIWTDRGFSLVLVRVTATPAFWIARSPVSCSEYDAYKFPINGRERDRPASPFGDGDDAPRGATWGSAVGFCQRGGLRLPSIVEWHAAVERTRRGLLVAISGLSEWCFDADGRGRRMIFDPSDQRRSSAIESERQPTIGFRPVKPDPPAS